MKYDEGKLIWKCFASRIASSEIKSIYTKTKSTSDNGERRMPLCKLFIPKT